ncbi:hypothetical protein ACIBVL_02520 [Streptomyces sp. NPDC049687]|uniref:hypothetical protein n=1 Tax=Streptomyces sp. NPDC049687 TaxID=3365596 RepID=UPI0037A3F0E2
MLRFMDWSVVALGCALVLVSLGGRWWERAGRYEGAGADQGGRFLWAWLPLLMGVGMIVGTMPSLLLAPHAVVMAGDTLNVVLSFTVLALAVRAVRRVLRARGMRA